MPTKKRKRINLAEPDQSLILHKRQKPIIDYALLDDTGFSEPVQSSSHTNKDGKTDSSQTNSSQATNTSQATNASQVNQDPTTKSKLVKKNLV